MYLKANLSDIDRKVPNLRAMALFQIEMELSKGESVTSM
jgi:hypothetical protein